MSIDNGVKEATSSPRQNVIITDGSEGRKYSLDSSIYRSYAYLISILSKYNITSSFR